MTEEYRPKYSEERLIRIEGTSQFFIASNLAKLYKLKGDFESTDEETIFSVSGLEGPPHIRVRRVEKDKYSIEIDLHSIYTNKISELEGSLRSKKPQKRRRSE